MLGLWEYFWDEADWIPAPPPPPPPAVADAPRSNAGGGHRKYVGASPDFWDVRERYLRRFAPKVAKPAQPVAATIPEVAATYAPQVAATPFEGLPADYLLLRQQALLAAMQAAQTAQTRQGLQDAVQRANALQLDISRIKQQHFNRAIALLLLDAF